MYWGCGAWLTGVLWGLSCVVAAEGPRIIRRAVRGVVLIQREWNWIYWFDIVIIELNNDLETL